MSYLPPSTLYQEPEPAPTPRPAAAPPSLVETATAWPASVPPVAQPPQPAPERVPATETVTSPRRGKAFFDRAHKVVLRQLDRATTRRRNPGDPDLLWFAVMSAGSVCMGLMIWGAYSALPRAGNISASPLRADTFNPKLKVVSGEFLRTSHESPARARPQAAPPAPLIAPAPLEAPHTPHVQPHAAHVPPAPPALEPVHVAAPHEPAWHPPVMPTATVRLPDVPPSPVEPPLAPLPERKEPVVFVHATLGETPMIRTWNKLAEASLLLAALTLPPVHPLLAQNTDKPAPPAVDYHKDFKTLTEALHALTEQVTNLKGEIGGLKFDEKLNAAKADLAEKISKIKVEPAKGNDDSIALMRVQIQGIADEITKLNRRLDQAPVAAAPAPAPSTALSAADRTFLDEFKKELTQAIRGLQPAEKRISLSPPTAPEPAITKIGSAHVIFVNLYNQDLWLWFNQKPHLVPANTHLTLSPPSGPAVIEVKSLEGTRYRVTPNLEPGETFTLNAR